MEKDDIVVAVTVRANFEEESYDRYVRELNISKKRLKILEQKSKDKNPDERLEQKELTKWIPNMQVYVIQLAEKWKTFAEVYEMITGNKLMSNAHNKAIALQKEVNEIGDKKKVIT